MIADMAAFSILAIVIILIVRKSLNSKNSEIEKLELENTILHGIIRQANIKNKPPKDLED